MGSKLERRIRALETSPKFKPRPAPWESEETDVLSELNYADLLLMKGVQDDERDGVIRRPLTECEHAAVEAAVAALETWARRKGFSSWLKYKLSLEQTQLREHWVSWPKRPRSGASARPRSLR